MEKDTLDRMHRLVNEAYIKRKIAMYSPQDSRDGERAEGAVKALVSAREILGTEPDKTTEETAGYVMRNVHIPSILGVKLPWLTEKGNKYLCLGEEERDGAIEEIECWTANTHTEILRVVKGTRIQILTNFLRELEDEQTHTG